MVASPSKPPLADRFREWARRALALSLPVEDEFGRLEWALTPGWKTALTEEVSEPFVQAATYHIFAVDGLRMAIVFGIFFYLFRALRLSRAVSGLVLIPLIWIDVHVSLTRQNPTKTHFSGFLPPRGCPSPLFLPALALLPAPFPHASLTSESLLSWSTHQ